MCCLVAMLVVAGLVCLVWCDGDPDVNPTHCSAWSDAGCSSLFLMAFVVCLVSGLAGQAWTQVKKMLCSCCS